MDRQDKIAQAMLWGSILLVLWVVLFVYGPKVEGQRVSRTLHDVGFNKETRP